MGRANPLRLLTDAGARPAWTVLAAWLAALVPSLALFAMRVALGEATLPREPPPWPFAAYSIAIAPLAESALMLGFAWLLDRALPGRDTVHVATTAIVFALLHVPGGGLVQGIAVAWPFVVYAIVLVVRRRRSPLQAFAVASAAHALYNATFVVLGAAAAAFAGAATGR